MSGEFLLTSLIVVLMPGTGVVYTVSTGLFKGWRAGIIAALGCTLGILPHLAACILGLSALLHMSAIAFQILRLAGAVYLLYLAWSMWREHGGLELETSDRNTGSKQIIMKAVLINILNPKLTVFFLAFLPLFINPAASPVPQLVLLSAIFMGITAVVFILYGLLAHSVRNWIIGSKRGILRVRRTFAVLFAGMGLKLALSD
jgi:threonine/homoserine/homoserine lactone efflux protein